MTTPDPATLREALEIMEPWEFNTYIAITSEAARWALGLIEGGKEVWWCETHHAQWRERWHNCYPSSLDVWLDGDCVEVKRLLVEP